MFSIAMPLGELGQNDTVRIANCYEFTNLHVLCAFTRLQQIINIDCNNCHISYDYWN